MGGTPIFSHICLGTNDFERAFGFYAALMEALGLVLKFREDDVPWAGWMHADAPRPLFVLGRPFDGGPAAPGNGQMAAFQAQTRAQVERCYELALKLGGSCEGPPGPRPHYHADYYGAYFRDLDGNKLCVVCHQPEER